MIDLAEKKGGVELSVRRLHQDDRVESATAMMDKQALDELWALVEAEHLQSADPPDADPNVMDGAGHILVLEWPDASGRAHVHALHWSNPKTTHAGVDRLFEKMAALARRSAPSVKLHYFP